MKRLGAAKIIISVSDTDGFKVEHGTYGAVLLHMSPDNVATGDWNRLWDAIRNIEDSAYLRWRDANPSLPIENYLATNPKNS